MDPPLPDDFNLSEHYGDCCDESGCDGEHDEDHESEQKSARYRPQRLAGKPAPKRTNFSHGMTSVYQRLIDLALLLYRIIAPPKNPSAAETRRHAVALSAAVAAVYGYIAISWGVFESSGISGFAKANDLAALQSESAEVRVTLYGIAIRDLYRSCRNATDDQDRLTLNNELQKVREKYEDLTNVPYLLPPCVEVQ